MPKIEQHQPEINVGLKGEGSEVAPEWIERKGERETVGAVLASWAEGGQGPNTRGGLGRLNRTYFRVRMDGGAVFEIAHEMPEGRKSAARWVLVRQLQDDPVAASAPVATPPAAKPTRATKATAAKAKPAAKKAPARKSQKAKASSARSKKA